MKILIMIPAYNEELNIERVVNNLIDNFPQYDYVVINDGSTDRTEEILKKRHYNFVSLPANLGIGGAIQTGYLYAYRHGYDIAVQLDGDGQHDPKYIKDVIQPIQDDRADYVVGSRFVTGEGFQSTGARRTGIRFLSGLIQLLCSQKVRDVTSGFRAVRWQSIRAFSAHYPTDYPEPEAIMDAAMRRERIAEVPVVMRERLHGASSIRIRQSFYYMIKVTLDIIVCRISYGVRRAKRAPDEEK